MKLSEAIAYHLSCNSSWLDRGGLNLDFVVDFQIFADDVE
jgi:hypothetical protein